MSSEFIAVGAPATGAHPDGRCRLRLHPHRCGQPDRNLVHRRRLQHRRRLRHVDRHRRRPGRGRAPYVNNPPLVEDQGRVFSSTPDLSVSKTGTGTGTVTSTPAGDPCEFGAPCFGSFLLGDQVTLTATPSAGSTFAGWENYPACTGTPGTCLVTMDREPQVVARFTIGRRRPTSPRRSPRSAPDPTNNSTVTTSTVSFGFTANETRRSSAHMTARGSRPAPRPVRAPAAVTPAAT